MVFVKIGDKMPSFEVIVKRSILIAGVLFLLLGCNGIKVSKSMLKMIVSASVKGENKALFYADSCGKRIGIPYVQNGDPAQVFDVYYADSSVRKDAVLIDIHGGFYVAGNRKNNRPFASVFLKEGYDVVLLEYRLNDGSRDVSDALSDCAAALAFLTEHAGQLGINKDRFFLTGDSAGGHLALYIAECEFTPKAVLLNCPAYDFASFANTELYTEDALAWFIGPRWDDDQWRASVSPRTHIGRYSGPLLVSTCTNDFIRSESLKLKADCDSLGRSIEFVDIQSKDKKVGHVHNVAAPALPESRTVNARMIAFMNEHL